MRHVIWYFGVFIAILIAVGLFSQVFTTHNGVKTPASLNESAKPISGLIMNSSLNKNYTVLRANSQGWYPEVAEDQKFWVETNSKGLRYRTFKADKPPNTTRILVLGDELVFGVGLNRSDVFTNVVERSLNESTSKNVQVVNAGIPGHNLKDYFLFLRHQGLSYDPDAVVITTRLRDLLTKEESIKLKERARKNSSVNLSARVNNITVRSRLEHYKSEIAQNWANSGRFNISKHATKFSSLLHGGRRPIIFYIVDGSLGTGIWKNLSEKDQIKLASAPKEYGPNHYSSLSKGLHRLIKGIDAVNLPNQNLNLSNSVKNISQRKQAHLWTKSQYQPYRILKSGYCQLSNGWGGVTLNSSVKVCINQGRYRGKFYPKNKENTNKSLRIMAVGDSVTFGQGVPPNGTYPVFLEKYLEADASFQDQIDFQVINYGFPKFNTKKEVQMFRNYGVEYNPDLVILQYMENDAQNLTRIDELSSKYYHKLVQKMNKSKARTLSEVRAFRVEREERKNESVKEEMKSVREYFGVMEDLSETHGFNVVLMYYSTSFLERHEDWVRKAAKENGWSFVRSDLSDMEEYNRQTHLLNPEKDFYLNTQGYNLTARQLKSRLKGKSVLNESFRGNLYS